MFLLVILSSILLVCASVPKYLPPEVPKPDICDKIGTSILNSLEKAGEAVRNSIPGKVMHFGRRITGQTCISNKLGLFTVVLDFVIQVDAKTKTYICSSHLFIVEGRVHINENVEGRILQIYPGEEGICEYKE